MFRVSFWLGYYGRIQGMLHSARPSKARKTKSAEIAVEFCMTAGDRGV
jgi:hypothetical protein